MCVCVCVSLSLSDCMCIRSHLCSEQNVIVLVLVIVYSFFLLYNSQLSILLNLIHSKRNNSVEHMWGRHGIIPTENSINHKSSANVHIHTLAWLFNPLGLRHFFSYVHCARSHVHSITISSTVDHSM